MRNLAGVARVPGRRSAGSMRGRSRAHAPRCRPGRSPRSGAGERAGSPRPAAAARPAPLSGRPRALCTSAGTVRRPSRPARAVSGAGARCAAEGPAQRKREYPPPFPSALSPQARPLAAARRGLGALRTADQARSPRTSAEPHHVCVQGWGLGAGRGGGPGVRRAGAALCV